jgi:hypothetical protein
MVSGAVLLACSVAIVEDEPLLSVAAPALAELPRASAARTAPPITSCLSRFCIIVFLAVVRDVPGYENHDGRGPSEQREGDLRISTERSRRACLRVRAARYPVPAMAARKVNLMLDEDLVRRARRHDADAVGKSDLEVAQELVDALTPHLATSRS